MSWSDLASSTSTLGAFPPGSASGNVTAADGDAGIPSGSRGQAASEAVFGMGGASAGLCVTQGPVPTLASVTVMDGCTIGGGTKMDNLSYVGQGSVMGPHNLLISKSHVGRRVKTGPYFLIAAVSCVDDEVEMGPLVQVAGFSRVNRSWTTPKMQLAGDPAQDYKAEIKERSQRLRATKMYASLVAKRRR